MHGAQNGAAMTSALSRLRQTALISTPLQAFAKSGVARPRPAVPASLRSMPADASNLHFSSLRPTRALGTTDKIVPQMAQPHVHGSRMLLLQSQSQARRIGRVGETIRFNSQGPESTNSEPGPVPEVPEVPQTETPAALLGDAGVVEQVDSTAVESAVSAATNSSGLTAMFGMESFFGESKDYPNIVFAQEVQAAFPQPHPAIPLLLLGV
eukprot:2121700-Rhodomonas_salina.8